METTGGGRALAPFQADFVRRFVQEYRRGAVYLLVGPVGIGKSVALAEAMTRLASEAKTERLLLLCPAPLIDQWAQRLIADGLRPVGLEPETYRLLLEEVGSTGAFPAGIYVVSIDFAKRPDVRTQLQHTSWDLVVVDEAHMLSGQRQRLVQDLLVAGDSALLLSTATPTQAMDSFGTVAARFDWYGRVAEQLAAATAVGPTAVRTVLTSFARSAGEQAVLAQVAELAPRLEPFVGQKLVRRAASSLNALELFLIKLVAAVEIPPEHIAVCRSILTDLERITTDAQLQCALDLVRSQAELHGHTVIFTDYLDTGRYILEAVADVAGVAFLMHGELAQEEQRRIFR